MEIEVKVKVTLDIASHERQGEEIWGLVDWELDQESLEEAIGEECRLLDIRT